MAYNSNIPQPADQLKNSQTQLLANFQEINTFLGVNHVGFNVADQGKHKFLQMPQQGVAPTTALSEIALSCLQGSSSLIPELSFRRQSDGISIALTEGFYGGPSSGWATLGNGMIMKWHFFNKGAGSGDHIVDVVWPTSAGYRAFSNTPFFTVGSARGASFSDCFGVTVNPTSTTATNASFRIRPVPQPQAASVNYSAYTLEIFAIGFGV